jgi:hypothetical protein
MPAKDELREVGPAIVATVVAAIGVFFLSAERVEFDLVCATKLVGDWPKIL